MQLNINDIKFAESTCDFDSLGKCVWEAMRKITDGNLDTLTIDPRIEGVGSFVISREKQGDKAVELKETP